MIVSRQVIKDFEGGAHGGMERTREVFVVELERFDVKQLLLTWSPLPSEPETLQEATHFQLHRLLYRLFVMGES